MVKRAYILADNKLALNAGWDDDLLAAELGALMASDLDFDIGVTGFSIPEIDMVLDTVAPEERSHHNAQLPPITSIYLLRHKFPDPFAIQIIREDCSRFDNQTPPESQIHCEFRDHRSAVIVTKIEPVQDIGS